MDKPEVGKLLAQIVGLYPNIKLSEDTAAIWVECLQDIAYDQARRNLIEHIKACAYPPTISAILNCREGKRRQTDADTQSVHAIMAGGFELYNPNKH